MKAQEIIEIRRLIGATQEQFAHLLGASFATINRWENGKNRPNHLYVKEIKNLRDHHESYIRGRKEFKNS